MTTIFIIEVTCETPNTSYHVSSIESEGYRTLADAQAAVRAMNRYAVQTTPYHFRDDLVHRVTTYDIHQISVR